MAGWIADHRKELESDIWLMPPMYHRVWQWVKYKAYHDPCKIPNKDGTVTMIQPGQFPTSYRNIAKGVGYYEQRKWTEPNVKTIKSILDWLSRNKMITVCGNTLGTIVTVENWALYQEKKQSGNTKRTAMETPREHDLDTNNNIEQGLNNENKIHTPFDDAIEEFKVFRKSIKKPMSDLAVSKIIKQLEKLADNETEKIEILEQSIANGWQGVFELKQPSKKASLIKHPHAVQPADPIKMERRKSWE